MNISKQLEDVIKEIQSGKPFTAALAKDDIQRVAFVALSQLFAAVEDLKAQLNAFENHQQSKKKWRD